MGLNTNCVRRVKGRKNECLDADLDGPPIRRRFRCPCPFNGTEWKTNTFKKKEAYRNCGAGNGLHSKDRLERVNGVFLVS